MDKQEIIKAIGCLEKMYVKSTKMVDGRLKGGYINKDKPENKAIDLAIAVLGEQLDQEQICKINKADCLGFKNGKCVSIENCYGKDWKYISD